MGLAESYYMLTYLISFGLDWVSQIVYTIYIILYDTIISRGDRFLDTYIIKETLKISLRIEYESFLLKLNT